MDVLLVELIRPHGEQHKVIIDIPDDYREEYTNLCKMGRFFTIERLPDLPDGTRTYNICISSPECEEDHDTQLVFTLREHANKNIIKKVCSMLENLS